MKMKAWIFAIICLSLSLGSLAEQCGRQAGGVLCPGGLCCSEWGFCGTSNAYCGQGCQSQCGVAKRPDPPVADNEQCGRQAGGALCPGGLCCSEWGFCGTSNAYCGQGCQSQCGVAKRPDPPVADNEQCGRQAGGALCRGGLCCSEWGFCGTSNAYCGQGCQSQCGGATRRLGSGVASLLSEQCGRQAGGALCPGGLCCSEWGFCGTSNAYCGQGCQSQCGVTRPDPTVPDSGVASLLNETLFEEFLKHRNNAACPAHEFYTYDAFVSAANSFSDFATTGETDSRKREIAAFFAQTSHETTGGWPDAPGGPYAWGYCFLEEVGATADYCVPSTQWPCAPGKKYFGRGPIQISYNYNYGPAGEAIGVDLLNNPELVAKDPIIAFKTALWFWMTPQSPKPSCHDVITEKWTPSAADIAANRLPGYGVTTNIINGGLECGHGADNRVLNRIGFYKRYCDIMGVSYGENLDCYKQGSFGIFVDVMK